MVKVGIRKEDKNIWEKRVPIIPEHMKHIMDNNEIEFLVEEFEERAFSDDIYRSIGATITNEINESPFVFGVKEIPLDKIWDNKVYMFFSHTIKGQAYNMPLLQKILDSGSTLIDYEKIENDKGARLVFFGRFAGLAGMIDTLHGVGRKYAHKGIPNPFQKIKPSYEYSDLTDAKAKISEVADDINENGLPEKMSTMVFGVTGYGNVSRGAQEILDLLPHKEITPDELLKIDQGEKNGIVKVVFKEEDIVSPVDPNNNFELADYYNNPEKYKSKFENYLPSLDVLINAIYWNEKYPRLLTKDYLKNNKIKLQVVGDITCDICGSVEINNKATESDNPAYVYNPSDESFTDGYESEGIAVMAVDNLPTELPVDASIGFSDALKEFIPGIVLADYSLPFENSNLPEEIKRAVIVYNGELTPNYKYLTEFLK